MRKRNKIFLTIHLCIFLFLGSIETFSILGGPGDSIWHINTIKENYRIVGDINEVKK